MNEYKPRIVDEELVAELRAFGAVLIIGPKWCGKTTTAERIAKSALYMQDPDKSAAYLELANLKPSNLLKGEKPRLIDEWQMAPNLWGAIRFDVDRQNASGLYILTGSTTVDESSIAHSGIGRISRLRMRTMSLFESGDSSGEVSLSDLFDGNTTVEGHSSLDYSKLAKVLVRGGWPRSIDAGEEESHRYVAGYCESILRSEINIPGGKIRNEQKMRKLLKSLSRNTATNATNVTLLKDICSENEGGISLNTLADYTKVLRDIYVIEDLVAWSPKLRSKTTIRTSDVRHISEPAIAAYFLGAGSLDLEMDPHTFGLLFESLAVRDLRVYSQLLEGDVFHYRDEDGLEVDAIVHLRGGKWCAIEVKLGTHQFDAAAANLMKFAKKVDSESMNPPSFLAILTGTEYAYTREDGVHVIPLGCLRN